jgi:YesN/AraC family two-component response regulator
METALRILNVDDNDVARYVKRRILAQAGHDVVDAASGGEAIELLQGGSFDMALVDMKMPDMSGFDLTRRIRVAAPTRNLPVIQISAVCITGDDEQDGFDSGADAYLMVPFEAEQLVTLVGEVSRARLSGTRARAPRAPESRVRSVDAFIRTHLAERLSVEDLAQAAGLSVFYFTRMFKAATGRTPHDYVMEVRVEEAEKLLASTQLPLGEIASRLGFANQAHFSAVFRRKRGRPPSSLRSPAIAAAD